MVVIGFSLAACGEGWVANSPFEFDRATGTITGYRYNYGYSGDVSKDVTIPAAIDDIPVAAIGEYAFRARELTGLAIADSVTAIGKGAFAENQLTSLLIGSGLIAIGEGAFEDNRLTGVTIPNSVILIGDRAFKGNQLTSITIGSSVTSIGYEVFAVNQLSSVDIPSSVTTIGENAFSANPLTSVTIGPNKNYASHIVPNFGTAYNGNGKLAGTYTRDNTSSETWTRQ
jgi:hypothetical protein